MVKRKNNIAVVVAALLAVVGALVGWGAFWYVAAAPGLPPVLAEPKPISILFVGDIMLDRKVAEMAALRGADSLFASSSELFSQTNLRIANLEGTVTLNPSIAQVDHSKLQFTFDPTLAKEVLTSLDLSAVSQANNHAYDFGKSGYLSTHDYLTQWGIGVFGHPYNNQDYLSTKLTSQGKTICLVGYMQLFTAATSTVVNEIQTMRSSCDKVIVFAHWGVEYTHDPTPLQVAAAHSFIDAGADVVIGAHPHVVQPLEIYDGKPIIYSLGNAMFDQDFSWDTTHGLAVKVEFYPNKTDLTFIPLTVAGERSSVAQGAARDRVLGQVGVAVASISLP